MLNIRIIFVVSLFILAGNTQARSTSLLINDDSLEIHHITNPNIMLLHTTYQEYRVMYSQEPGPRNLFVSGSFESESYAWKIAAQQTITPRALGLLVTFKDENIIALAAGAVYRYRPEESKLVILGEVFGSPRLTTFIRGNFVLGYRAQANYTFEKGFELNIGYRNINIELDNRVYDGFERGLYFGFTHYY